MQDSDVMNRSDVALEIANLKERFDTLIAANERAHALRDRLQEEALRVATESNNSRLEHMNEFRGSLADQSARMITRTESEMARNVISAKAEELHASLVARFDAELRPVNAKLDEIGRPNWTLMIGLLSVSFVLITGIWLVIGLKIDATLAPVVLSTEQLKISAATNNERARSTENNALASTQADLTSRTDRAQLNERVRILEAAYQTGSADRRADTSTIKAQLVEIETQFKSMSDALNIQKDQTQQFFSMIWEKVFGKTMPLSNFRPNLYRQ
jgi:archaellum component FlaC